MTYPVRLAVEWSCRLVVAFLVPVSRAWERMRIEVKWRNR
jgi:hypothetical protein